MGTPKVLIVGAGIGGLSAGIALRQAGFEVCVFEGSDALKAAGAGLSLWGNAIHVLRSLGVWEKVPHCLPLGDAGALRAPSGRLLMANHSAHLAKELGDVVAFVHRAELQAALLDALGRENVRLGARCTTVAEREGAVEACFSDGSRATGDILLGADGLRSAVRAFLHGEQKPRYSGYTAWRSVVKCPHRDLPFGETLGRGARFGLVPLQGERIYWYATANAPEGARDGDEKAFLLARFAGWHTPIEDVLRATAGHAILRNDIYDRDPIAVWGRGRVTLLGDAAHPMTPNLGQGACQALEDAFVLAAELQKNRDAVAALKAYEQKRIPRVNPIVMQARRIGAVGQWSNPVAVALRNLLFRSLPARWQEAELRRLLTFPA